MHSNLDIPRTFRAITKIFQVIFPEALGCTLTTPLQPETMRSASGGVSGLYAANGYPSAQTLTTHTGIEALMLCHEQKLLHASTSLVMSQGKSVRDAAQSHAQQVGLRLDPRAGDPMTACYLDSSYPAMLHFAVKYPAFSDALLASANAGGENVARGACLGAMMGASVGVEGIDKKWIEGLVDHEGLAKDIDAFVAFLSQQG